MADKIAPYGVSALVTGQTEPPADIAKVKRNIQRMIDQDAPEADIDEYVASEGLTPEQLRGRSAAVDQRGKGVSVLQGATFGFGDEIVSGGVAGLRSIYDPKTGEWLSGDIGKKYDEELTGERQLLDDMRAEHPYMSAGLEAGGAMLTGTGLAGTGASLGANAIRAGQGLGRVAGASAAEGAALGGVYGFGAGEGGTEERLGSAAQGFVTGGIGGAAAPYVVAGGNALVRNALTPFRTSPERSAMAQVLANEGVDLTAGQRTGSNALRYAESEIGGQRAVDLIERQGEQFTAAALRRAGINADRATPDVIDDGFRRIGQEFDGLAQRNMLQPDVPMYQDLTRTLQEYESLVPQSARAPIVRNTMNDILQTVRLNGPNGTNAIQGSSYQALSSRLGTAARNTTDPQLAHALRGIKDAIDDAMERSIGRSNPRDLGAWRDARRQYRNLLVIEKAATGAGENAALGLISPSHLRNATVQQSRRGYARGQGDFAELARAGEATMKALPNSGTPGRTAVRALGTSLPALLGAGGGATFGGPLGAMLGMAAGAALPKAVGRIMMTDPMQRFLANQAMIELSPGAQAILNAGLVSGGSGVAGRLAAP